MKKKKMLSSKNSTFANFQNLCIEHQVFLKVVHLLSTVRRLRTDTNQSMIRLTCFPKFIEPCRTQKVVIVLLSLNFVSELQLQKRFPGGENIVWYDDLAPRPDVLHLFSSLPASKVTGDHF